MIVDYPGANALSFSHAGDQMIISGLAGITRMRVDGTERVEIMESDSWLYGIFGPNDEVLYTNYSSFVVRIPKVGRQDTLRVDTPGAIFPFQVAPDGRVIFVQFDGGVATSSYLWDADRNTFEKMDSPVAFITPSGHALYVDGSGGAQVAALDESYRQAGDVRPISYLDRSNFAVGQHGLLVYEPDADQGIAGTLHMRPGGADRVLAQTPNGRFDVSPDGRRIVYQAGPNSENARVVIQDLESGLETPIAQGRSLTEFLFNPDGSEVWGFGRAELMRTSSVRSEVPQVIMPILGSAGSVVWLPGGESFLLNTWEAGEDLTLKLKEYDTTGKEVDVIVDAGMPANASVSPDGRFVSYFVYEGQFNVSPPLTILERSSGRTWQLPLGDEPGWARFSRDGREIEYRKGDSLMVVPIRLDNGFQTAGPARLEARADRLFSWRRMADGTLFWSDRADSRTSDGQGTIRLNVVVNWFDELERIAPTGRR